MKININYPTGNWFEDGTAEIGKVKEYEVDTREGLADILPECEDYFLTLEDGTEVSEYEACLMLDEKEESKSYYYWLDTMPSWTSDKGALALVRGELDEDGQKNRETEEVILEFTEEDVEADEEADYPEWDKIDWFIENAIGFIPEYEVN